MKQMFDLKMPIIYNLFIIKRLHFADNNLKERGYYVQENNEDCRAIIVWRGWCVWHHRGSDGNPRRF